MRHLLLALALLAPLGAAAQQAVPPSPAMPAPVGEPNPGRPDVQGGVPEMGRGRGPMPGGNPPATTEAAPPTGTATAPAPRAAAPTPVAPVTAPPPFTDRNMPDAEEMELQRMLQGGRIEGRVSIPDQRSRNLVQPQGREWRDFHNVTLAWVGGIAVGGMILVLLAFFLGRGRIRTEEGHSGRTITRFNLLERANHWMVATSFIILGLSGLNLTFGRHVLLPVIGPYAFATLSGWGKVAHNFLAFPFTLGILLMLLLWVRDNIPNRRDIEWFRMGGGLIGRGHPKAGRFNAGQKVVFWITVLGGSLVAVSGYFLIFPFWGSTTVNDMQLAHIVHSILSVLMIAAMIAHIYIGSIGMEGAFDAMGSGQVDLNWAREHHSLWVEEEMAKARQAVLPPGTRPAGD